MKSRRYKLPLIALSLSLALPAFSQSWFTPEVEKRAEDILKNMTVKERLTYIGGIDWMYTRAIPRLNVPAIKMSDGPQGVGTWGASHGLSLRSFTGSHMESGYGLCVRRSLAQ